MHGERSPRTNGDCPIFTFLPYADPLISQVELYDDELPLQFCGEFNVAIENFHGEFLIAILTDNPHEKKERLPQIHEIGNAFQRRDGRTGMRSPNECSPAVVDSAGSIERRELCVDLFHGDKAIRSPELPIENRVRSFDGAGVPRTPWSIENDHHAVVTPPPNVASNHTLLIDAATKTGIIVLLDHIRKRQLQAKEHDGEDAERLRRCLCMDAEEELFLLRSDVANAQEVDGRVAAFDVPGTDEIELHEYVADRREEAGRVEHVLRPSFLFLAMRLGTAVRLECAFNEIERWRCVAQLLCNGMRSEKNSRSAASRVLRTRCSCFCVYVRILPFSHPR